MMFAVANGAHKFGIHNPNYLQAGAGYQPPKEEVLNWLLANMKGRFEIEVYSSGCDIFFLNKADTTLYQKTWFMPPPALLVYRGLHKKKDARSRNRREGNFMRRLRRAARRTHSKI
jgi:hypothetical protein